MPSSREPCCKSEMRTIVERAPSASPRAASKINSAAETSALPKCVDCQLTLVPSIRVTAVSIRCAGLAFCHCSKLNNVRGIESNAITATESFAAVRRADANDSVAVIAFDSFPRTLLSFEQWQNTSPAQRIETAVTRIEGTSGSWQSTHWGRALVSAAELILDAARGDAEGARSTIVLISDLQQGSRLDGIQGFEWPRGVEVSLQPIGSAQLANAGVQILAPVAGEGLSITNIALRARVVNSPGAKSEQFKIGWVGANDAFAGKPLDLHVPGGQNRSIGMPPVPTNSANLMALLTGD